MPDYKAMYQDYLNSPEWAKLREEANEIAGNRCELCHDKAAEVHHIKYPKRFKEDCVQNLVVVCKKCHERLHGLWDPFSPPGLTSSEEKFIYHHVEQLLFDIRNLEKYPIDEERLFKILAIYGKRIMKSIKENMVSTI